MKCLVLTQPWASLVAFGEKSIETRSWRTSYRGPLAIMAGKGLGGLPGAGRKTDAELAELCGSEPFASALRLHLGERSGPELASVLPRGVIVAVAGLVDIVPTERVNFAMDVVGIDQPTRTFNERAFGNYEPGRCAWLLERVRPIDPPVEIPKGAVVDYRGIFDVPPFVQAMLA